MQTNSSIVVSSLLDVRTPKPTFKCVRISYLIRFIFFKRPLICSQDFFLSDFHFFPNYFSWFGRFFTSCHFLLRTTLLIYTAQAPPPTTSHLHASHPNYRDFPCSNHDFILSRTHSKLPSRVLQYLSLITCSFELLLPSLK